MSGINRGSVDTRGFDKEFTRWTVPNVETLSGDKTITSVDARVQLLHPGANVTRVITLDASLHVVGTRITVMNTDGYYGASTTYGSLNVVNSSGTTLHVNPPYPLSYGQQIDVVYTGTGSVGWIAVYTSPGAQLSGAYIFNGNTYLAFQNVVVNSTGFGIGASPSSLFHVTAAGDANALRVDNTTGQVLVGASAAITSASAVFGSATGAIVLNRWTTTERDALTATKGMVGYNTTTDKAQVYNGAWVDLH